MRFAVILAAVGLAAGLDTTNFAPPAPPCDMEHLAAREKGGYKIQCKGATILGDPNLDFEYFYLSYADFTSTVFYAEDINFDHADFNHAYFLFDVMYATDGDLSMNHANLYYSLFAADYLGAFDDVKIKHADLDFAWILGTTLAAGHKAVFEDDTWLYGRFDSIAGPYDTYWAEVIGGGTYELEQYLYTPVYYYYNWYTMYKDYGDTVLIGSLQASGGVYFTDNYMPLMSLHAASFLSPVSVEFSNNDLRYDNFYYGYFSGNLDVTLYDNDLRFADLDLAYFRSNGGVLGSFAVYAYDFGEIIGVGGTIGNIIYYDTYFDLGGEEDFELNDFAYSEWYGTDIASESYIGLYENDFFDVNAPGLVLDAEYDLHIFFDYFTYANLQYAEFHGGHDYYYYSLVDDVGYNGRPDYLLTYSNPDGRVYILGSDFDYADIYGLTTDAADGLYVRYSDFTGVMAEFSFWDGGDVTWLQMNTFDYGNFLYMDMFDTGGGYDFHTYEINYYYSYYGWYVDGPYFTLLDAAYPYYADYGALMIDENTFEGAFFGDAWFHAETLIDFSYDDMHGAFFTYSQISTTFDYYEDGRVGEVDFRHDDLTSASFWMGLISGGSYGWYGSEYGGRGVTIGSSDLSNADFDSSRIIGQGNVRIEGSDLSSAMFKNAMIGAGYDDDVLDSDGGSIMFHDYYGWYYYYNLDLTNADFTSASLFAWDDIDISYAVGEGVDFEYAILAAGTPATMKNSYYTRPAHGDVHFYVGDFEDADFFAASVFAQGEVHIQDTDFKEGDFDYAYFYAGIGGNLVLEDDSFKKASAFASTWVAMPSVESYKSYMELYYDTYYYYGWYLLTYSVPMPYPYFKEGIDILYSDFKKANFEYATLFAPGQAYGMVTIGGAGTYLYEEGANFNEVYFYGANLKDADFHGATLAGWMAIDFYYTEMEYLDLSDSFMFTKSYYENTASAYMYGGWVAFHTAWWSGGDWFHAFTDIDEASFHDAYISTPELFMSYVYGTDVDFSKATFYVEEMASFWQADLENADFQNAEIISTYGEILFEFTNLDHADFDYSELYSASWLWLWMSDLSDSTWRHSQLFSREYYSYYSYYGGQVVFLGSDVDDSDWTGASVRGSAPNFWSETGVFVDQFGYAYNPTESFIAAVAPRPPPSPPSPPMPAGGYGTWCQCDAYLNGVDETHGTEVCGIDKGGETWCYPYEADGCGGKHQISTYCNVAGPEYVAAGGAVWTPCENADTTKAVTKFCKKQVKKEKCLYSKKAQKKCKKSCEFC